MIQYMKREHCVENGMWKGERSGERTESGRRRVREQIGWKWKMGERQLSGRK